MQLSFHADYACRTLIYLALLPPGTRSSIEEIAKAYGISVNHLVKVVHALGRFGFVETTRGRGGGLRLARPAREISIGDVIRKTEPGFELVECFRLEGNACPITPACGLKPWLGKAMAAFLTTLDNVTLADVTERREALAEALSLGAIRAD